MANESEQALTDEEIDSIRKRVLAVKLADHLSHETIAREADLKSGTSSSFLGNTYAGDNAKIAAKLQIWLGSRSRRRQAATTLPQAPDFIMTKTSKRLMEVLDWAQFCPDIVVGAGGAGLGKTTTCEHYAGTNPNVWLATMHPSTASVHTMLQAIASAVGVTERSASKLADAIGQRVQDTGGLIIIDEAQHLVSKALDEVRILHDVYGVGIAFVGNENVYGRLQGEGRKAEFAQLFSRIGMRFTRERPFGEDICALIAAWGVEDKEAVKTLKVIASKPGALRVLTKTLRLATMLARGAGEPLSDRHVRAAWERLTDNGADRADAA